MRPKKMKMFSGTGFPDHRIFRLAVYVLFIFLFSVILVPLAASANMGRGYIDLGGGYKTGDFGTPTTSNLYYLSSIIGYGEPRYDISVNIPYLLIMNKINSQNTSEYGLGDIILRGGSSIVPEGESGFSLYWALAVKLPTADNTKGLGTGEADYGSFVKMNQVLMKLKFSLVGGYIKIGDTADINYNDIYLYGFEISRVFGSTDISVSFVERRSAIPGNQNAREITIGIFHVLNMDYAVRGSAFKGLNKSSPDFGIDLGIVKWF